MNKTIFFIFSIKEVKKLEYKFEHSQKNISNIDLIVSVVPGINMEKLNKYKKTITFEKLIKENKITQKMISTLASNYSKELISSKILKRIMRKSKIEKYNYIKKALLNYTAIIVHDSFGLSLIFDALIRNGMQKAIFYCNRGGFQIKDLYDTNYFLDNNLYYKRHLQYLCNTNGIAFKGIKKVSLGNFSIKIRDWTIYVYRFIILSLRCIKNNEKIKRQKLNAIHLIRSEVELYSSEPIIKETTARGDNYIYIVDDLMKFPTCTKVIKSKDYNWLSIHSFTNFKDIYITFIKVIWILKNIESFNKKMIPNTNMSKYGFLGESNQIKSILYKILLNSLPEIIIHEKQLKKVLNLLKPKYIVSYDQIDKYGAVQGSVAKENSIGSVMIQTTAIDDIKYPYPLSMDNMIVSSEKVKDILLSSGAKKNKIHDFGLPSLYGIKSKGDKKIEELLNKRDNQLIILIATQPFVSDINYNDLLVNNVINTLAKSTYNIKIVIKPHPREAKQKNYIEKQSIPKLHIVTNYDKFENLLKKADIVISRTSTVIQTSIIGGVPPISYLEMYPSEIINRLDYLESKATYKCLTKEQLSYILSEYISKERRIDKLKEFKKNRNRYINKQFKGNNSIDKTMNLLENI
ncbi:hypothetical protein [Prochlorococcus marinus]|nr:hypothetical protein [Prochlorococcus marinus]